MTELRPMSEAPNDEPILALLYFKENKMSDKPYKNWTIVYCDKENNTFGEDCFSWNESDFLGWVPLPEIPE